MTKTKRQLRAEAVERLRKLNCMDVDCYQLLEATVDDAGEKVGYRVEISKLIDLLTDEPTDCQPLDAQARAEIEDAERSRAVSGDAAAEVDAGTGGTEKTPQEPRDGGRITFTDTREMLEEDARDLQKRIWRAGAEHDGISLSHIIALLDRQAAITEMEMQAKVDELEAENARLRSRMSDDAEYGRLVMGAYRELRAKMDAIREAVGA